MQIRAEHSEHAGGARFEDRRLLSVSEVAELTGLSRPTIYRRIRAGEWPSGRSGRKHLIPRSFVTGLITEIEAGRRVVAEGYTVAEVAELTGLSRWTIYRRIRAGEWPSGRSGRKHLIPRVFVEGLLNEIEAGRQVTAEGYAAAAAWATTVGEVAA